MTVPQDVPPLEDQPAPPYGTWRATMFGDDGSGSPPVGQMTWEPGESERARAQLHDQVHDEGVWRFGPGERAIWHPAPADEDEEVSGGDARQR